VVEDHAPRAGGALVERSERIVTREELYNEVWGEPYRKADRSVDVYVGKLRQKLDRELPGRNYIHTHFGIGYRFAAEPADGELPVAAPAADAPPVPIEEPAAPAPAPALR